MAKVICPHCGAENPKSPIVTSCQKCMGSLAGAQPAPGAPAPDAVEPVAPAPPGVEEEPPAEVAVGAPPTEAAPPVSEPPPRPPEEYAPPPVFTPPAPLVPPTAQTTPAQQAPAAAAAASPAPGAGQGPVQQQPGRQLGGKGQQRACCIGGLFAGCAGIFVLFVGGLLAANAGAGALAPVLFVVLIVGVIGTVLAILLFRSRVAAAFYEGTVDPAPSPMLGETFTWGVTVTAKKPMTVGTAVVTLRCQEHAISRGGTSDSHYRKTLYEQRYEVPGKPLTTGEQAQFRATVTVPANAVPSHRSGNNFIEWKVEIRASVPGYCPDIKDEEDVWVRPCVAAGGSAPFPGAPTVPADWISSTPMSIGQARLGGAWGTLQAQQGPVIEQTPVLAVGETRDVYLWVQSSEEIGCRGVLCWVGCRIHGSGTDEEIELLPEHEIHSGPVVPGQAISYPLRITVPAQGPVSFVGRYVKLEWVARVRFDIPLWFDKRMWVPFVVTPQRLE